jgi:hypothetical protein
LKFSSAARLSARADDFAQGRKEVSPFPARRKSGLKILFAIAGFV